MSDTPLPSAIISPDQLRPHVDEVRILDVRGIEEYERGHIPGAEWVAFDDVLAGAPELGSGARRPLPTPSDFAAAMVRVGVGDESVVVVYDDTRGSRAARLWWMLDSLGVSCAVLDGGFPSWSGKCESGSAHSSQNAHSRSSFTVRPWPQTHFVDIDEVARGGNNALVLDARSEDRFDGAPSPLDPRPGHIPKAQNAPWTANVSAENGRMLPRPTLQTRFAALGIQPDSQVLLYCGSGVTACHNALALRLLGVPSRVYVGSWSEWASDATRPIET